MKISRRTFIAAGVAGAAALAAAGWLRGRHAPPSGVARRALDGDAEAIVGAIVPVLLADALPTESRARADAIAQTVTAVDIAVAGLPPAAQAELAQLFALLALPPARVALAGVGAPWAQASAADIRGFLDRFRDSSWTLLRSAYDALHQLIYAAWYGNPQSWPAIGYPGPPVPAMGVAP